jgi:Protein of unknown function (DUF2892)
LNGAGVSAGAAAAEAAMTVNEGSLDRIVRIVLGAALLIVDFALEGAAAWIVGIAGILLLATAIIGWCPAYTLFGIDTRTTSDESTV